MEIRTSFETNVDDLLTDFLRFLDDKFSKFRFWLIKLLAGNRTVAINVEVIDGSLILTDGCFLNNVLVTNNKGVTFRYPAFEDYWYEEEIEKPVVSLF